MLLDRFASMIENKNKIALCDEKNQITYNELIEHLFSVTEKFRERGITSVGIWASNSYEWGIHFIEAFFSNVSIFVFPTNMRKKEIEKCCINYNIQMLYSDTEVIYNEASACLSTIHNKVILFSSGSTGLPKGIVLSKEAIWGNAEAVKRYMNLTSEDKVLIVKALYHSSTLSGELLPGMISGITVEIFSGGFFARKVIRRINQNGITVMGGAPSLFLSIMGEKYSGNLRKVMVSGSFSSPRVLLSISEYFKCQVYHVYGLSEAGPRVTYLPPEALKLKPTSIGIPIDNVVVTIIDEAMIELQNGEVGEILVASNYLMEGYLNDPVLTCEKLTVKGLRTGDIGYKDDDGYLYLLGRKDDMICRSGENIWPNVIDESVLKVDGVFESVTIGIKDEYLSQKVVTFIRVDKRYRRSDLYRQCRVDLVKRPDEIYLLEEIPKLSNGKYDKLQLEKMYECLKKQNIIINKKEGGEGKSSFDDF